MVNIQYVTLITLLNYILWAMFYYLEQMVHLLYTTYNIDNTLCNIVPDVKIVKYKQKIKCC